MGIFDMLILNDVAVIFWFHFNLRRMKNKQKVSEGFCELQRGEKLKISFMKVIFNVYKINERFCGVF